MPDTAKVEDTSDRKPKIVDREPAQIVLNQFLKDNQILIGTDTPKVEFTNSGVMMVSAPNVIAVYKDEANG